MTNKYTFRSLGMLGQMYDPIGGEANFPDGTEFYLASDIDARTSEPGAARPSAPLLSAFKCSACGKIADNSGDTVGWALCPCGSFRQPEKSGDQRRCVCGVAVIPEGELRVEIGPSTHRLAGPCFQTPSQRTNASETQDLKL